MYPVIDLSFLNLTIRTVDLLSIVSVAVAILLFVILLRDDLSVGKIIIFVLSANIIAVICARIFHVVVERPHYFFYKPQEIFGLAGLTFYGAFLGVCLAIQLFNWLMVSNLVIKQKILDVSMICLAMSYGILRIGCFLNGCCWGKITKMPWAVRYFNEQSLMPYLGIPVHPVQLYDATLGFGLAILLYQLRMRTQFWHGKLIYLFCLLYAVGRFFTENYRGDSYRGTNVVWDLSISQIISLGLFITGSMGLIYHLRNPSQHQFK